MGRKADTIARGIRRHEHGSHIILDEESADGVTILAVVGARAVETLTL